MTSLFLVILIEPGFLLDDIAPPRNKFLYETKCNISRGTRRGSPQIVRSKLQRAKNLNPKRVWPKYNRYAKTQSLAPNNKTQ